MPEDELMAPDAPPSFRAPPVTVVAPEYVLAPVSVSVPALWLSEPEPEMTPVSVWAAELS